MAITTREMIKTPKMTGTTMAATLTGTPGLDGVDTEPGTYKSCKI